jgi:hypothetical protein
MCDNVVGESPVDCSIGEVPNAGTRGRTWFRRCVAAVLLWLPVLNQNHVRVEKEN